VPEQSEAAGDTKQSGAVNKEENADAKPAADEEAEQTESGTRTDAAKETKEENAEAKPAADEEAEQTEPETDAAKETGTKNISSGAAAENTENRPPVHRFEQKLLSRLVAGHCVVLPKTRPFHLFGLDCTSVLRPFADTLPERGVVHAANPAPGNKPVGAGHEYSALAWLPEKTEKMPPWVVPLSFALVPFSAKGHVFGMEQLSEILNDETIGFGSQLCVVVGDTAYSAPACRQQAVMHKNLILTARLRGNRAVYRQPEKTEPSPSGGHPPWYGKKMKLDDEASLDPPDGGSQAEFITKKGRKLTVIVDTWDDILVRGKEGFASHEHPFTLARVRITDEQGRKVFKKDMWIMVQGERRHELTPVMIYESYRQRFDMEHFFRFGKQQLLMDKTQTPETLHEEAWVQLTSLAYVQLYLSRNIAERLPHPWERYLPEHAAHLSGPVSPSQAQRDFARIVEETGTPAKAPEQRGVSPGRARGERLEKRPRQPVKFKNAAKSAAKTTAAKAEEVTAGIEKQGDSPEPASYLSILHVLQGLLSRINMSLEDFLAKTHVEVPP
jgi:hypothetical protein